MESKVNLICKAMWSYCYPNLIKLDNNYIYFAYNVPAGKYKIVPFQKKYINELNFKQSLKLM